MAIVSTASARDLDSLTRLNEEVQRLHFEHRPERFLAPDPAVIRPFFEQCLRDPECRLLIARNGEEAVGYVLLFLRSLPGNAFCHPRRFVELDQIVVASQARCTGVGSLLLAAVKQLAEEHETAVIELSVWCFNATARRFFDRHGFACTLERRACCSPSERTPSL